MTAEFLANILQALVCLFILFVGFVFWRFGHTPERRAHLREMFTRVREMFTREKRRELACKVLYKILCGIMFVITPFAREPRRNEYIRR